MKYFGLFCTVYIYAYGAKLAKIDSSFGVIPCQLIQPIAPTISDFDETYLSGGTFGTNQEKLKFLKIGSVLTKL